jgi:hypothetical protein
MSGFNVRNVIDHGIRRASAIQLTLILHLLHGPSVDRVVGLIQRANHCKNGEKLHVVWSVECNGKGMTTLVFEEAC